MMIRDIGFVAAGSIGLTHTFATIFMQSDVGTNSYTGLCKIEY